MNARALWRVPVYGEHPPCAAEVLASAIGITPAQARLGFIALFRAGYCVAPQEPTNAMLDAYLGALPPKPGRTEKVIAAIGKARRRWQAMALAGNKIAMCDGDRGEMVDAADLKPAAERRVGSSPTGRTKAKGENVSMDASEIVSRYLGIWLREIPEGTIIKMRDLAREAAEAMVREVHRLTLEELKK